MPLVHFVIGSNAIFPQELKGGVPCIPYDLELAPPLVARKVPAMDLVFARHQRHHLHPSLFHCLHKLGELNRLIMNRVLLQLLENDRP